MSKSLIHRNIKDPILSLALNRNKMAFLSGPRQVGKTTLAKSLLSESQSRLNYKSWDQSTFRKLWSKSPALIAEQIIESGNPILVLDEFHKNRKWKNQLKGFYDEYGDFLKILVTGSSHINTFRKGADSLLGRFLHCHI